jgi:Anaerobic dehydrogenases, typically selenocysteine-containing
VNDGRPTKIEGNPNHPFSFGRANSYHQAAVLGVYDPDRSTTPRAGNQTATWNEILALPKGPFSASNLGGGDGLRFLSEKISAPSLQALKTAALQKFPKAKWVEYDSIPQEEATQGAELAFGQPVNAVYHFDKADVVLSLDSDFLGLDAQTIQPQKTFADRRRASDDTPELNRLYVVESQFSITGANADHRLRLRSADIRDFASDLAGEMKIGGNELKVLSGSKDEKRTRWLAAVAKDLGAHKGKSIVVAGPRQPAAVHALAYLINQALGNIGTTISFYKGTSDQTVPQIEALRGLVGEMSRGQVSHLVILGGNPVYTAPADFDFAAKLEKSRQLGVPRL